MNIRVQTKNLVLLRTFATSRNVMPVSRSYFLWADDAVGEAVPVRYYGETNRAVQTACRDLAREIKEWLDPREAWPLFDRALGYNYAAKCGLDLLLWDHFGRVEDATVGEILGCGSSAPLPTALSIGIGTPAEMQTEVLEHPGFDTYKLKVGFDGDVEAVAAVREKTTAPFYVDANGGWDTAEACRKLPQLAKLGVVLCEQPIFSGRRHDWERVRAAADMPVIVDEHCRRPDEVAHWVGWVDGVNVKLQKTGGITPAREMIQRAYDEGLQVMLGCMIESSVSIAAAAQLAPLADYLDLDAHLLLAADPYDGIPCREGALHPSGRPGLGVWPRGKP